jgi:hypothetical protein
MPDLPVALPEDATFDKPGNALDHHPTWKHVSLSAVRRPATRETRHDGLRSSTPRGTFARFTDPWKEKSRRRARSSIGLLPVDPVHRRRRARDPAPLLFALLHRAMKVTGTSALKSRSPACSRRAWWCTRPTRRRTWRWSTPAEVKESEDRAANGAAPPYCYLGEEVNYRFRLKRMSKSKRHYRRPRTTSSATYGADVARWFMLLTTSPPDRDVIWPRGVQGSGVSATAVRPGARGPPRSPHGRQQESARIRSRAGTTQAGPYALAKCPRTCQAALQSLRRAFYELATALQASLTAVKQGGAVSPAYAAAVREAVEIMCYCSRR